MCGKGLYICFKCVHICNYVIWSHWDRSSVGIDGCSSTDFREVITFIVDEDLSHRNKCYCKVAGWDGFSALTPNLFLLCSQNFQAAFYSISFCCSGDRSFISMMEKNPVLLWIIQCYKQKASDKSDPHTMLYLYTFNVYSLLLVLLWNSFRYSFPVQRDCTPLCRFSLSWIVHGFCENVVIEFWFFFGWKMNSSRNLIPITR